MDSEGIAHTSALPSTSIHAPLSLQNGGMPKWKVITKYLLVKFIRFHGSSKQIHTTLLFVKNNIKNYRTDFYGYFHKIDQTFRR